MSSENMEPPASRASAGTACWADGGLSVSDLMSRNAVEWAHGWPHEVDGMYFIRLLVWHTFEVVQMRNGRMQREGKWTEESDWGQHLDRDEFLWIGPIVL